MTPADPLWLLGVIGVLSVAAGLSLYATLAALGLVAVADLASLPPRLAGLEAPLVWAPLLVLYAGEAALARSDGLDLLADSAHSGIRPLGAVLLAAAASAGLGPDIQWITAVIGGGLALWTHLARSGLAVVLRTSARPDRAPILASAAEGAAILLVLLASAWPAVAVGAAALVVLVPVPWIRRLRNAGRARRRATWALLSYPFHGRAWQSAEALPPKFAKALSAAVGRAARIHRIAPAVARRLAGVPPFASGWLAFTSRGVYFLFQGLRRPRVRAVPPGRALPRRGRVFDALLVGDHERSEFLLPKNAPRPDTLPGRFPAAAP